MAGRLLRRGFGHHDADRVAQVLQRRVTDRGDAGPPHGHLVLQRPELPAGRGLNLPSRLGDRPADLRRKLLAQPRQVAAEPGRFARRGDLETDLQVRGQFIGVPMGRRDDHPGQRSKCAPKFIAEPLGVIGVVSGQPGDRRPGMVGGGHEAGPHRLRQMTDQLGRQLQP